MANTIPIRPWSRLAFLNSSPDSNPKPHTPDPSLNTTNTTTNDNNSSVTKSQPTTQDVNNPIMQSQKVKHTTPMTFPHAKLKVHPQPVVDVTIEKPNANASLKKESEETKKENETKEKGNHAKHLGYEGSGIRVITISGENRGAEMQITKSHKKPTHKSEKVKTLSSPPMRAMYGNSNVQFVNNSMLFNTSLNHHDPGMHLVIPKKPIGEEFHLKKRVDGQRN